MAVLLATAAQAQPFPPKGTLAGVQTRTLGQAGEPRSYLIQLPAAAASAARPLVVFN